MGVMACRIQHVEEKPVSDVDAAVELLQEGFGLKVGNFVQQRRVQKATCDPLRLHDSHTATLSQLNEVTACSCTGPTHALCQPHENCIRAPFIMNSRQASLHNKMLAWLTSVWVCIVSPVLQHHLGWVQSQSEHSNG